MTHARRFDLKQILPVTIRSMSGGNPGSASVLMQTIAEGARIDPKSIWGEYTGIVGLDEYGIYDENIWKLYKDVCNQDICVMLGLLRSVQMGILDYKILLYALEGPEANPFDSRVLYLILYQLKQHLPTFVFDNGIGSFFPVIKESN